MIVLSQTCEQLRFVFILFLAHCFLSDVFVFFLCNKNYNPSLYNFVWFAIKIVVIIYLFMATYPRIQLTG